MMNITYNPYTFWAFIGILFAYCFIIICIKQKYYYDIYILKKIEILNFIAIVNALLGGRILWCIIETIKNDGVFQFTYVTNGGMVFYGGLLMNVFVGKILLNSFFKCLKPYTILFITAIPLFHAFGRIGCFFTGCCFGKVIYGFQIPIQIVESIFCLSLFLYLNRLSKKNISSQTFLNIYLLLYAVGRFFIEFGRGDLNRGLFLGFSSSQIVSILIILFISFVNIKEKRRY